ncbi:MAG: hypothetical protein LC791_07965 [Acidobacteria bacterium]|nr:hypothetical protein [Acidobacteriota bacterium]
MPRFLTVRRPGQHRPSPLTEFYREEFLKHQRCLHEQREYYSPQAIQGVEAALVRIIAQLDKLSAKEDANLVVASLLKEFDVVTRLSTWSDPHNVH